MSGGPVASDRDPGYLRLVLILGLLSATGPLAIDMYLPALPEIGERLGGSVAQMQATLTAYFVTSGVAQLVYGPVTDAVGRKPILYFGLGLFAVASVGCALVTSVEALIAFRLLQGAGGAAIGMVPRAVVRDLYTGVEATRLTAFVMLVFAVSPLFAPFLGSLLIIPFGWRAVFLAVAGLALLSGVFCAAGLSETLPAARRLPLSGRSVLTSYGGFLSDRTFLGLAAVGGFGLACVFLFVANASYLYGEYFGLSPFAFSVAFAVNGVGFFAATQGATALSRHLGMKRAIQLALLVSTFATLALVAVSLAGLQSLPVMVAGFFVVTAGFGVVLPTSQVLVMEEHGADAGTAAAVSGTVRMVMSAGAISAGSLFASGDPLPLTLSMALCATGALVLSLFVFPHVREPAAAMAPGAEPVRGS